MERVVVLDTGEVDDVVSLGLTPVGVAYTAGSPEAPAYLPAEVEGITTVGTTSELNLEAIAALQPDLILGSQLRAEDLYPQLSRWPCSTRSSSSWSAEGRAAGGLHALYSLAR